MYTSESDMNNIDKKWNLNCNYHTLRKKSFRFLKHNSVIMKNIVKFWIEKYSEFNALSPNKNFQTKFCLKHKESAETLRSHFIHNYNNLLSFT